jgi:hypothetical protein
MPAWLRVYLLCMVNSRTATDIANVKIRGERGLEHLLVQRQQSFGPSSIVPLRALSSRDALIDH